MIPIKYLQDGSTIIPITGTAAWAATTDSAANAAATLTKAAVTGNQHFITAIEVAISGGPAASDITIRLQDGATTIWKEIIGSGAATGERAGFVFSYPVALTAGNAANLAVSAGGANVIATLNLAGYTA